MKNKEATPKGVCQPRTHAAPKGVAHHEKPLPKGGRGRKKTEMEQLRALKLTVHPRGLEVALAVATKMYDTLLCNFASDVDSSFHAIVAHVCRICLHWSSAFTAKNHDSLLFGLHF